MVCKGIGLNQNMEDEIKQWVQVIFFVKYIEGHKYIQGTIEDSLLKKKKSTGSIKSYLLCLCCKDRCYGWDRCCLYPNHSGWVPQQSKSINIIKSIISSWRLGTNALYKILCLIVNNINRYKRKCANELELQLG